MRQITLWRDYYDLSDNIYMTLLALVPLLSSANYALMVNWGTIPNFDVYILRCIKKYIIFTVFPQNINQRRRMAGPPL